MHWTDYLLSEYTKALKFQDLDVVTMKQYLFLKGMARGLCTKIWHDKDKVPDMIAPIVIRRIEEYVSRHSVSHTLTMYPINMRTTADIIHSLRVRIQHIHKLKELYGERNNIS